MQRLRDISIKRLQDGRKKCGNPFLSIKFFVVCHGFLQLSELLIAGYVKSTISTIEKRFGLSSQTSGSITAFNEFGNAALIVIVSYFGSRVHRPRMIGCGALLVCTAGFLLCLPHFIAEPYTYDKSYSPSSDKETDICLPGNTSRHNGSICGLITVKENLGIRAILQTGHALLGIGGVPIQPYGISYIDDYASKQNSPLYLGFLFAVTVLGPGVGFIMGSAMLRYYDDFDKIKSEEVPLTVDDPRWVGAWWLGFLMASGLIAISAIPYFFFPKEMELEDKNDAMAQKLALHELKKRRQIENITMIEFIKNFPKVLLRNVKQPAQVLVILGQLSLTGMVVGLITFMAKFLEQQFSITASLANFIIGSLNIPGAMIGIIVGGTLMKKFRMSLAESTGLCTLGMLACFIFASPLLFLGCSRPKVFGPDLVYPKSATQPNFPDCYKHCNCPEIAYNPVCDSDGTEYMSPCFAGCTNVTISQLGYTVLNYTQCNCIISATGEKGFAKPGNCGTRCYYYLLPFIIFSCLSGILASLSHTPSFIIILRSVKPEDKSVAVGLQYMILRALAWMPGPVIYGSIIDSTCIKWSEKCGDKAACLYYNNNLFRYRFIGSQFFLEVLSFLCFLLAFVIFKQQEKNTLSDEGSDPQQEKMTEQPKTEPTFKRTSPSRFSFNVLPKKALNLRLKAKRYPKVNPEPKAEAKVKLGLKSDFEINYETKREPNKEPESSKDSKIKSEVKTKPETES